jgi:hypothetical protein
MRALKETPCKQFDTKTGIYRRRFLILPFRREACGGSLAARKKMEGKKLTPANAVTFSALKEGGRGQSGVEVGVRSGKSCYKQQ